MKWVWRILATIILAIPVAIAAAFFWLRGGVPSYDGVHSLEGLGAPVEIMRDSNAVPHIFAANDEDAYFTLGYVQAQDRLWQMDMQRRIGAGRLSEIVGSSGLSSDRFMRTLGLYRQAKDAVDRQDSQTRAALQAYADGVNAWIETRARPLPPEYLVVRSRPEPWRPADSVVWGKLMALQLSGNFRDEVMRGRLADRLPAEAMDQLFPPIGLDEATSLSQKVDGSQNGSTADRLATLPDLPLPYGPSQQASNAWVLSGEHTRSGAPILANDPHLGLSAPIMWYLARIETPNLSLTGATVPGVPFHILGHNSTMAWGFTTTGSDTQDLVIEQIDQNNPDHYRTPDGPLPFQTRTETIRVRGENDDNLEIRSTRHGPVISDIMPDVHGAAEGHPDDTVVALAFTALTDEDTTPQAFFHLNRAQSWDDFTAALADMLAPQQNVFYADTAGTIGMYVPGALPIRSEGADPTVPQEGWLTDDLWPEMVPFEELPHSIDPDDGMIINANNQVAPPDYPHYIAPAFDPPFRAERIEELLTEQGSGDHTIADSAAILMDTLSPAASELVPILLQVRAERATQANALSLLRNWNHHKDRDRPEPLIFGEWMRHLTRSLFEQPLGPAFEPYWGMRPRVVEEILTRHPHWCDEDAPMETDDSAQAFGYCEPMVLDALDRALDRLSEQYGSDVESWRWGNEHFAPLNNQVLSRIPVIRNLTDLSVETDGGYYTVNRGAYRFRDGSGAFRHIHGAGLRVVHDLSDLSRSRFMIATGQSGNPLSDHYGNFVIRWRDGDSFEISGDPAELADTGLGALTLRPKRLPDDNAGDANN